MTTRKQELLFNNLSPCWRCLLIIIFGLWSVGVNAAGYQQLPGHFGGFGSDGGQWTVADDFQFGQDTLVGSLTWWGGDLNPPNGPDNFRVSLFSDSGGHPGSLLDVFDFGQVNAVATGQFVNAPDLYPEFEYSASFPTLFAARAGVKYWVSIVDLPADIWLWEASSSSLNPGVQRESYGGAWQPYYDNTAFRLVAVPEPSSALLLTAGFAGLVWLLRRRRLQVFG
jgi:hypothetical protein